MLRAQLITTGLCLLILVVVEGVVEAEAESSLIGVSTALTGNASTYGQDIRNALEFANKKFTGGRYQFILEDDKCDGKTAATIAQKLVHVDKVPVVLGFACSGAVLASAPIYEKAGVLAIASSASAAAISDAGDYIFRTWPSDAVTVAVLFAYVQAHHSSFGVLSEETDYAQGLLNDFLARSKETDLRVITESYLTDDTDFRATLQRLRAKGIDGIFVNSQSERTFLAVIKQLHELKMNLPVYGVYWPGSATFLKEAGELSEGIRYVDAQTAKQALTEHGQQVLKEFEAEFGAPQFSGVLVASAIESLRAADAALAKSKQPKNYLYEQSFEGLFGTYRFDQNGDIIGGVPLVLKQIQSGKPADLRMH